MTIAIKITRRMTVLGPIRRGPQHGANDQPRMSMRAAAGFSEDSRIRASRSNPSNINRGARPPRPGDRDPSSDGRHVVAFPASSRPETPVHNAPTRRLTITPPV